MGWLERCEVRVVEGDLFYQSVEALVVPVECSLTFTHVLGCEVLRRYGQGIHGRAAAEAARLFDGHMRLGGGFSLSIDHPGLLKHIILVAWWGRDNAYSQNLIESCMGAALRRAFEIGSPSLAMPLFGVNSAELNLHDLYAAVPKVLREFDDLRGSDEFSVEDLRFVCRKPLVVEEMGLLLRREL